MRLIIAACVISCSLAVIISVGCLQKKFEEIYEPVEYHGWIGEDPSKFTSHLMASKNVYKFQIKKSGDDWKLEGEFVPDSELEIEIGAEKYSAQTSSDSCDYYVPIAEPASGSAIVIHAKKCSS